MKKKLTSLLLMITIIGSLITLPTVASASSINIGDYVVMGTYYDEPILWRCVDIDEHGPLMLSDKIISIKPFDVNGTNNLSTSSHGRGYIVNGVQGYYRQNYGSNYWGDSNMRSWLNSNASAGNVVWLDGNPPREDKMYNGHNEYDQEAGFLTNFSASEQSVIKTVTQKSLLNGYEYRDNNSRHPDFHIYESDIFDVVQNYDTAYSETITDKMFLLDVKQVNEVYNNRNTLGSDYYIGEPTQKAVDNSEYKNNSLIAGNKWHYWLRSPSGDPDDFAVRCVGSADSVSNDCAMSNNYGLRPAFYINLSSAIFTSGNGSEDSPYTVKGEENGKFTLSSATIKVGESKEIEKSGTFDSNIIWSSSNKKIATVSNGVVTGMKKGVATIYARDEKGRVASCSVKILDNNISISNETSADDIAENLNFDPTATLDNISLGNQTIKGPEIEFLEKKFNLFEMKTKVSIPIMNANVKTIVDHNDKKFKVLIGFKAIDEKASIKAGDDGSAYWEDSYKQVKNLYKSVVGDKANTKDLYNGFRSLRKNLKPLKADLLVDADFTIAGYAEYSYETGEVVFCEGGFISEASIGAELEGKLPSCPVIYGVVGLKGSVSGKISVAYEEYLSISSKLEPSLTLNVGVGLGEKKIKTYIEGGLKGILAAEILSVTGTFKEEIGSSYEPLIVTAEGKVYLKGSLLGFISAEEDWSLEKLQLYPWQNSRAMMSMQLFESNDPLEAIKTAVPINRDYLYQNRQMFRMMSLDQRDKLYSDTSIYDYNEPQITTLPNGNLLMLYIDDNGTKNDVNKTSLYYTIYDGATFSTPIELFETGTYNGSPIIYNNGDRVDVIWTKGKKVLGDDASLLDLIESSEIYYTSYKDGDFSEPVQLTNNNSNEISYYLSSNSEDIVVSWVENSENDPYMSIGTNRLYKKELKNGVWGNIIEVASTTNSIGEITPYFKNGNSYVAYSIIKNDNTSVAYINSNEISNATNLNYENGFVYYSIDNIVYKYDLSGGDAQNTNVVTKGNFSVNDGDIYTLLMTDYKTELYENRFIDGAYQGFEQVTEFDKYIRNYHITKNSAGEPIYALNLVDVLDGENVYGNSELCVVSASDIYDLSLDAVYIDEDSLIEGGTLPMNLDISNRGNTDVTNINLEISDKDGNTLDSQSLEVDILAGEETTLEVFYSLPEIIEYTELTLKITDNQDERNLSDNTNTTSYGVADVLLENLQVERLEGGAVITGRLYNNGYGDIKNAMVIVKDYNKDVTNIATINCGDLLTKGDMEFSYTLPQEYLTLPNKAIEHGLTFEVVSDSSEYDYANNSESILFGELTGYDFTLVCDNEVIEVIDSKDLANYKYEKDGKIVGGWYYDNEFTNRVTSIDNLTDNMVIFAKMIDKADAYRVEFNNLAYENSTAVANVSYENILDSATVVVAVYDNDKLIAVRSKDITYLNNSDEFVFSNVNINIDTASIKAFIFEDFNSLKPLANVAKDLFLKTIEIDTVLESSHDYADDEDETKIYTYDGNCRSIDVTFSSATETESGYDYIYILDRNDNQIGKYEGTQLAGKTINIPGNTVKIRLTSDGSVSRYGYRTTKIVVNR